MPPIFTVVAPAIKFVPVMVMLVPPASGPTLGATVAIVGSATYVKPPVLVTIPPTVVTATSFAPTKPAGVTAVMEVALTTTTLVAATPPTFTVATATKFAPVIVIVVAPVSGPLMGATVAMVGSATYVNPPVLVAVPPAVVTATSFAPTKPAGVTAVMEVALTTTTLVAATPPTFTVAPAIKFVPAIVMVFPAVSGPDAGNTLAIVGAST